MIELHSPESEGELLFLKSLLDEAGIPYFVHNERFGSLLAGPQVALYNRRTICVHHRDHDEAAALIGDFLRRTGTGEPRRARHYSLAEKLRMVAEFLVFGWFLPGRRPQRRPRLELVKGFQTQRRSEPDNPGSARRASTRRAAASAPRAPE